MKDEQRYQRAKERVEALKGLYGHLTTFLAVGMALFLIDLLTPGGWWFYWPLLFWGIGLTVQAVSVGMPGGPLGHRWEAWKIREYMDESDRTSDSTPPAPCRPVRRIADPIPRGAVSEQGVRDDYRSPVFRHRHAPRRVALGDIAG